MFIPLVDLGLKSMSKIEAMPQELQPQVCICVGDLNLLPSKNKVVGQKNLLRPIDDHDIGFTQVDHQLLKIAKKCQSICLWRLSEEAKRTMSSAKSRIDRKTW